MGCSCCCVFTAAILFIFAYIVKKIYKWLFDVPEVPTVDEKYWWGVGQAKTDEDTSVKPFQINVSDKDLEDFKQRLSSSRLFTPPLETIQHQYGINTNLLTEIKNFWENQYDWRKRETYLNQFPQYTTTIQGLNIHFLHVKPTNPNGLKVVPLLILHGWCGSIREFYETIPKLVQPSAGRNFVFEVVAPSLPGYGFSEGAARPGLNPTAIAAIFKQLMVRLNFEKWYVQGGDWGSEIGTHMAIVYPRNVLGLHLNMAMINTPRVNLKRFLGVICPSLVVSAKHRSKMYPLSTFYGNLLRETGYMHIQATKPDTVGVGLNDSPIGLAAYMLEKFIVWTNVDFLSHNNGGLSTKFGYEKLLDNVMIYWFTKSITTSMRLYAESFAAPKAFRQIRRIPVLVPSAYAQFGDDLLYMPEGFIKDRFKNLLQYSDLPVGGHFAAFEEPELFAEDVWNAVEKFENYQLESLQLFGMYTNTD